MALKSPAFQMYPGDFLSDEDTIIMTAEQVGAYFLLLCHAWKNDDCGLENNDKKLALLSRMGEEWLKGGSLVKERFFEKDSRLYNKRLLSERKKQAHWKKKSREGGIKSGKARKELAEKALDGRGKLKGGSTKHKPTTNSSSSFSSSSSLSTSEVQEIYSLYPRKVAKPIALVAIDRAALRLGSRGMDKGVILLFLKSRTEGHAKHCVASGKETDKIPHPSTWYNQDRFDDEIETQQQQKSYLPDDDLAKELEDM